LKNLGPIIIVDDDMDDIAVIKEAAVALNIKNTILTFTDGFQVLEYLKHTNLKPFFILCDINMPKLNGFELRENINSDHLMVLNSTPFIFLSTSKSIDSINKGYKLNIQGYFTKPGSFEEMVTMLKNIIAYWSHAHQPFS
jgi:CheY-like chemotaxis protein